MLEEARQTRSIRDELDEMVHEAYAGLAAQMNNRGVESQIAFLIDEVGFNRVFELLSERG